MELLSEMATLSAVCTVLGTRLYKSDIKQHISEIIYNKGTSVDVRVGIEDFIRSGIRKGEMEHADLLTPILQGIEFAEMCMDTVKEDPLP